VHLEYVRHLSGPNIFTTAPVCIARLELDELTCRETTEFPGFSERLALALPGLRDHHCAAGRPGGFTDALARGTYFGHVVEHVALELSALAGREVHLGRTMWAGADGRYDVMTECPTDEPEDSVIPAELYQLATTAVNDFICKKRPELTADLAAITQTVERERLGPSSTAIAAAARRRGIPVRRLGGLSMLRLGYGCHGRLVSAAMTEQTSALGVDIACDKVLAKQFLARAGIPVPDGILAHDAAQAAAALDQLGGPVVIKPRNGNHGKCVTVGIRTRAQAEQAYRRVAAGAGSSEVIVESYIPGSDYRVLVIGGQVIAAAELRPAEVTGDGTRSINELITAVNADPRRGHGHSRVLTKITVDDVTLAHLAANGLNPDSVPAAGQQVSLRQNGNLSTGGTSKDVTDVLHTDVAEMCQRAADAAGLDICGIDVRLTDISAGLLGGQPAAVIEINACPGLRMHLAPAEGKPRDVADAIIDRLYPPGARSRIPILAVTGTNGKTTTVRMITHVLNRAGFRTGMSCTDGVYVANRYLLEADASGPRSAEMVLDDRRVEAAVLETARGGIIRRGLGYDKADVAVITNISSDHLGDDGIDELAELVSVKALIAEELNAGGSVVLNASDPITAAIADRQAVRRNQPVIRYFSATSGCGVLELHKRAGGICYDVRDGRLTETDNGRERVIMEVGELPGAFDGRARHVVANALAAIAACRAVGIPAKEIREALSTFEPTTANPGRGNVYAVPASPGAASQLSPVLVDYGHNAAALLATGELVATSWAGTPVAAVTLPGDRRDDLVAESAEAIATWFAAAVIYEDDDLRGRTPGEMRELIAAAMRKARPGIQLKHASGARAALREAITLAAGGPVLFIYEKLAAARSALDSVGAVAWPAGDQSAGLISDRLIGDLAQEIANASGNDSAKLVTTTHPATTAQPVTAPQPVGAPQPVTAPHATKTAQPTARTTRSTDSLSAWGTFAVVRETAGVLGGSATDPVRVPLILCGCRRPGARPGADPRRPLEVPVMVLRRQ
jgi:cyanophycin synthetase